MASLNGLSKQVDSFNGTGLPTANFTHGYREYKVLIPDSWGKSSDCNLLKISFVFNSLKYVFWIPNFLTIKNIA